LQNQLAADHRPRCDPFWDQGEGIEALIAICPRSGFRQPRGGPGRGVAQHVVRRAELDRLPDPPAPRATRIIHVGDRVSAMMPYNLEVLATYRGRVDAEWMLSASGNHIATCGLSEKRRGCG
jgi:hypothetical protein